MEQEGKEVAARKLGPREELCRFPAGSRVETESGGDNARHYLSRWSDRGGPGDPVLLRPALTGVASWQPNAWIRDRTQ